MKNKIRYITVGYTDGGHFCVVARKIGIRTYKNLSFKRASDLAHFAHFACIDYWPNTYVDGSATSFMFIRL